MRTASDPPVRLAQIVIHPVKSLDGVAVPSAEVLASGALAGDREYALLDAAGYVINAKRSADLLPLCHPLLVGSVTINFEINDTSVDIEAQVETVDRTGVEMEALTACSVAALTVYDMCKSRDRSMVIGEIALWEKTGGRSGHYKREARQDSL